MAEAKRDDNRVTTLLGLSSVDGTTPTTIYVNPTTHRVLASLDVTDVSAITGLKDDDLVDADNQGFMALGTDGTNYQVLAVDSDGNLQVDIVSGGGAGTQYTEADTDASITGTAIMWEDGSDTLRAVSAAKPLPVEITDASIAVTGTFWQATQPVSLASAPTTAVTGTFWQATQPISVATIPSHAVTNAGTFAVQPGSALTGSGNPTIDSYTHVSINLAAGANQVLVASAASKQIWVYGIGFVVNVAGTVSFQDEDDLAITGIMPFAANSGMGISPSGNFAMPIWKLGTDKDLEVDIVTSELDGFLDYAIVSV